ncbi:accessory gene regulator B family protein, partial [Faecalicoccus pleomorphus]|nr:accessory gene regulator B family protein [Faecalicoccus pleomorphus]
PLDHPNKKITKNEKTVFKKKGFIIEIFFLIILLICKFFNFNIIVNSICMSFICSSISQVIALIKIFREQ